ncbi:hypothetical protein BDZ94DRAFT_1305172 [Collybia nuda]|uniref:Carrier domain-containing protein n=1 Tax=Collybia nuda TaxID=64659 RepID=A0A9P6CP12_9AGAR|nr:hypothetical protein BDZ94DRAFT_1305172 [Collybia nuda]
MLISPENPPSMAGSSNMGFQCPPIVSLPVDYEIQQHTKYEEAADTLDIEITNSKVLSALTARFLGPLSATFSEVVASIFCTTLFRITGHADGTLLFSRGIFHAPSSICYDIEADDHLPDLINRQLKSTHYYGFPDTQHHKIHLIIDSDEHTDASVKSSAQDHPALTRWALFQDGNGSLRASITFSAHVFQQSTIHSYANVFKRLIEACALNPPEKLSTTPICTPADVITIRNWNNTQKNHLDVPSLGSLFRRVAKQFSTNVAVTNGRGGLSLTYEELDRASDALALWLIDHGHGGAKETIIGIWQSRGVMVVVSCLACIKAGCAYMLIEKNLPTNRIKVMLEITDCPLVIVDGYSQKFPLENVIQSINLRQPEMETLLFDSENKSSRSCHGLPEVAPTRLAYVVFTSGSTGVPKAVMVQHDNLLNCLLIDLPNLGPTDRMPMIASIAFDASIGETWLPLTYGATLVAHIPASGSAFDVNDMANFLQSEEITGFVGPTSMVRSLLRDTDFFQRDLPALRWLAVGGEAATSEIFGAMFEANNKISFINLYGPSECTIYSNQFNIPSDFRRSNIPIGRTTPNIRGYVVDNAFNLVPPGVCGELFLVGDSITRGYLGQPELTESRFVVLPSSHPLGAVRGYRTGDLVRALSTGDLEFVRRKEDGQIKLRSHRVELGEIEHVIKRHSEVTMALVVLCQRGNGNDHLVAYFTSEGGDGDSQRQVNEIRDLCKAHLSAYMVPSFILRISAFPLSVTGKVDRKRMATTEYVDQVIANSRLNHQVTATRPALSPQERSVLQVFADTLGSKVELLNTEDNFYDLGGHSMIAVQVVTAIKRVFSVSLPMHVFMDNATAASVSEYITNHQSQPSGDMAFAYINRVTSNIDTFPASNAQMGIWVQEQINPGLTTYNTGFQRRLEGTLNVPAMEAAFHTIIDRHDVLRTTFNMHDRVLMQHVHPTKSSCSSVRVQKVDSEAAARAVLLEQASQLFDLTSDIPIRVTIVVVDAQTHYLSTIIHHIATDGWSLELIDTELTSLYNTLLCDGIHSPSPLDVLPVRYGDFAGWQNRMSESKVVQDQLRYWSEQLKGTRALELFTDYPRPVQASGRADEIEFDLDDSTVESLRQLAFNHRTSLYVILLAAFRAFVYRLNGEEQGTLGMVNANRSLPEIANVVGFFVNTHAIHVSLDSDATFEDLIHTTRGVVAAALEHSDVPFDQVVAEVVSERHLARNVLIQLELVLQDFTHISENKFGGGMQEITSDNIRMPSTNLDLAIHFFVRGGGLRGYMMYQTDLFSSTTVQSHVRVFKRIVESLVANPESKISVVDLFTSLDAKDLSEWNDTTSQAPIPTSLVHGFQESAKAFGPDLAVTDSTQSLSYHELDKTSDDLASFLITKGFKKGDSIGIFMGRSTFLVIAYLACLKAGLAYLPLDRSLPANRLHTMVQIAHCRLVLTNGPCPLSNDVECIDITHQPSPALSAPVVPFPLIDADTVCCYMFTSGSTGVPKGVVVEHRGMVNLCASGLTHWPGRRRNAVTNGVGFDPSGFQIFTSLLTGSPLYCLPDEGTFDGQVFIQFLLDNSIQRCDTTPSIMASLLTIDEGNWLHSSSLEHILLGGEKVEVSQITDLHRRRPSLKLSAVYGPTEASVTSTIYDLSPNFFRQPLRQVPLGRAVPNTSVYVLDRAFQPVPAGVLGEIAVSGPNVCRGYLDLPEVTAKVFIDKPSRLGNSGEDRMYLTGDLGYWQASGQLNFAGRIDSQVKIRGQRIETSEVEHALNSHPSVKSSTVVVIKDPESESESLIGYVQLHEKSTSEDELLALWSDHYNDEALLDELVDSGADSAQWASMLDGKPINQFEMDGWLDDTVSQIAAHPTDRLLEIGIGTGQIALRVAESVTSYVGTDISRPSLAYLQRQVQKRGLSSKVSLHSGPAHALSALGYSNISLAVINSVVQYFPSAEYLTSVISELAGIMSPNGRIFIGDVRSYPLIAYHDTERALASLPPHASTSDVRKTLDRLAKTQTELLLSPEYFYGLQRRLERVAHVEVRPKDMEARNELSRYRYAAVLHIGQKPKVLTPSEWHDFNDSVAKAGLVPLLRNSQEDIIGITRIPIVDLVSIRRLWNWIQAPETTDDVACLRTKLSGLLNANAVNHHPATLAQTAAAENWTAIFDHSHQSFDDVSNNYIQAIFTRTLASSSDSRVVVGNFRVLGPSPSLEIHNMITNGEKAGIPDGAKDAIVEHLRAGLPKYMIPRIVEIKGEWPLTRTGKLDVKLLQSINFLKEHDESTAKPSRAFELPKTETERRVLAIFSEVLKRPESQLDALESFFDLGGHSLRAAIAVGSLRREFDVTISMAAFFLRPCIRDIATAIDTLLGSLDQNNEHANAADDITALAATTIIANPESTRPGTLFMFPESTGFASAYSSAFASIPYKVIAFGEEHWGSPSGASSIRDLARDGVAKMRTQQAEGPYWIAGWSLGGYVALEAAAQLEEAGHGAGVVVMFDSILSDVGGIDVREEWREEYAPLLELCDDRARWMVQMNKANVLVKGMEWGGGRVGSGWRVVLVRAMQGREGEREGDGFGGWRETVPQIEVVEIETARHRTMFDEQNGPRMGRIIRGLLEVDRR